VSTGTFRRTLASSSAESKETTFHTVITDVNIQLNQSGGGGADKRNQATYCKVGKGKAIPLQAWTGP
jgi:hypothetical protein